MAATTPFTLRHILAPTDLSASSVPALRYARLFADRFAAKLTVMYAEPLIYPGDFGGPIVQPSMLLGEEDLRRLRAEVERHAGEALAGRPYDFDVTAGDAVPSILAAASERNADLLVVGTHRRHGWRRALIGSVSDGVLHGSRCPVLTVAGRDVDARPGAVTNVLCPVNFSEVAAESLRVAGGLAAAFGARLTIVHVVETPDAVVSGLDEERVRRWVEPALQERCSYREVVLRGGPAERVLDCADDLGADLLVIGAQHKLFRDDTVVGATTERLIRFAACPVLVVPREAVERHVPVIKDAELMVAGGR